MLATAHAIALVGLEPHPVRVEVQSGRGTAFFDVVGLPEATVRESRVRVRAALGQIGVNLASSCITVNLAPADLRKTGSGFDLAIAAATLASLDRLAESALATTALLGELSLTGAVRPIRGVLPRLVGARSRGLEVAIVPRANGAEAAAVAAVQSPPLEVFVADDLAGVVAHLAGSGRLDRAEAVAIVAETDSGDTDLADVRGQWGARRALEIAAAGGHDLLMIGPPGAGKTMLARRFPSVLPALTDEEALEVTAIHSVAGDLPANRGLLRRRPFRAPHHTVSDAGLLGGGDPPRPGELSLAHGGVLFLDELPEFRRCAIEGLRQPLEDGVITIARAKSRATFPARPIVLAAMNPCPCGFAGAGGRRCKCGPDRVRAYRARISGPIVDRLDLHIALPPVEIASLGLSSKGGESTADVRARVVVARGVQAARRSSGRVAAAVNARLSPRETLAVARPDDHGARLLTAAMERLGLSARAYGKVLRIARTIADLDGSDGVHVQHVAEAIQYRLLDRRIDDIAA